MQRSRAQAIRVIRDELLRLEQFRRLGVKAAMLAHEVRTPLASLALNLELEIDEEPERPGRRDSIRSMLDTCERISAMLGEFLEQARAPAADPTIEERVDRLCAPLTRRSIVDRLMRRRIQ
jgi:signal transduction histidine kinase